MTINRRNTIILCIVIAALFVLACQSTLAFSNDELIQWVQGTPIP